VAPSEAHRAQAIEQLQKSPLNWDQLDNLKPQSGGPLLPQMSTLCIAAGRKDKVRPGDILGALTGEAGIPGAQVGKIAIFDFQFQFFVVAVSQFALNPAYQFFFVHLLSIEVIPGIARTATSRCHPTAGL